MGELVDLQTKKLINNFKATKVKKKQKTISFLKGLIKDLENDDIDPEKCIVLLKWETSEDTETYNLFMNDMKVESVISLLEFCKQKYLEEI